MAKSTCPDAGNPAATSPIGFGELTHGRKIAKTIAPDVPVARPLKKSAPKLAARDMVTGRHKYTLRSYLRPGMLMAAYCAQPAFGATLLVSTRPCLPGVTVVREKNFVGVAASDAPRRRGSRSARSKPNGTAKLSRRRGLRPGASSNT